MMPIFDFDIFSDHEMQIENFSNTKFTWEESSQKMKSFADILKDNTRTRENVVRSRAAELILTKDLQDLTASTSGME